MPASRADWEVIGVFNPGAVRVGDGVVLLVRVAERPRERRPGFTALPRWDPDKGLTTDWVRDEELEQVDARVVRRKVDGLIRLTSISHLRVIRCGDGQSFREISEVTFCPRTEAEEFGVEDARITPLNGRFYFTYVAVSRHGPATALASTTDFLTFDRHGVIFCPENKDVVLFPQMVGGDYLAIHRPVCGTPFTRPEMWVARSPDLTHWGAHMPLKLPSSDWQCGRVGAGPPPLSVPGGWLVIYHGNRHPTRFGEVGEYAAGAILLDKANPAHVLSSTVEPFMRPEAEFERIGFVSNVVFPTGVVQVGEKLHIYYGAADMVVAVAEFSLSSILDTVSTSS